MIPKLLVIDLDGTLVGSDGTLPAAHVDELHRARAQGIELVVATGRSWNESQRYLEALEADGVMVAAGGAMLVDAVDGQTLARSVLPADVIATIAQRLNEAGHLAQLLQDHNETNVHYVMIGPMEPDPTTAWWLAKHDLTTQCEPVMTTTAMEHTVRVAAVGTSEELAPVVALLEEELGDRVLVRHWEAISEGTHNAPPTYLLEAFNADVDKWFMVKKILADRGLNASDVVAIGDGLNDIEMLEHAGLGIAMGQAKPEVRAVADRIVASNDEGGFIEALRSIVPA